MNGTCRKCERYILRKMLPKLRRGFKEGLMAAKEHLGGGSLEPTLRVTKAAELQGVCLAQNQSLNCILHSENYQTTAGMLLGLGREIYNAGTCILLIKLPE